MRSLVAMAEGRALSGLNLAQRLVLAPLAPPVRDPRPSLRWAVGPGLARDTTLAIWDLILEDPDRAGPAIRIEMRRAHALGSKGRGLASAVLYGMIRHGAVMDLLIAEAGGRRDDPLHRYLAYLVFMEGLEPERAAGEASGVDFRLVAAGRELLKERAALMEPVEALALGANLPRWLAHQWLAALGDEAVDLVRSLAERPPMAVRVNLSRGDRQGVADRLAEEGVPTVHGRLSPRALVFEARRNVHVLSSFRHGLFEVQDEGSQLVADLLEVTPGLRVVDYCAGAGGKSLALADAGAKVWALDIRHRALADLERRAERGGLQVRVSTLKRGTTPPVPDGWAQAVLVDAPCSASGVLRRRPEQRFLLRPGWVEQQVESQRGILAASSRLVPPGGQLVYATCSLLEEENQGVVEDFLARCGDFGVEARLGDDGTLWPHRMGTDGFFGVRLRRVLRPGAPPPVAAPCA